MFRLPHNPGSLVEALDVFKQNKINLTWIESFPAQTPKPEYLFFVDFEGHQDDPKVGRAIKALGEHCSELTHPGFVPDGDDRPRLSGCQGTAFNECTRASALHRRVGMGTIRPTRPRPQREERRWPATAVT